MSLRKVRPKSSAQALTVEPAALRNFDGAHAALSRIEDESRDIVEMIEKKVRGGAPFNAEKVGTISRFDDLNVLVELCAPELRKETDELRDAFYMLITAAGLTFLKDHATEETIQKANEAQAEIFAIAAAAHQKLSRLQALHPGKWRSPTAQSPRASMKPEKPARAR